MRRFVPVCFVLGLLFVLATVWWSSRAHESSVEGSEALGRDPIAETSLPERENVESVDDPSPASPANAATPSEIASADREEPEGSPGAEVQRGSITLWGLVTDNSHRPVTFDPLFRRGHLYGRCEVDLFSRSGTRHGAPVGQDGRYSVTGLDPGFWEAVASVPGYQEGTAGIRLETTDQERQLDIVVERYPATLITRVVIHPVDGELTDELMYPFNAGESSDAGVRIVVSKGPMPELLPDAPCREIDLGLVQESGLSEGPGPSGTWIVHQRLELWAELPVHAAVALGNRVLDSKEVVDPGTEVQFDLSIQEILGLYGGIRFRVVGANGLPPTERCDFRLGRRSESTWISELGNSHGLPSYPPWSSEQGEVRRQRLLPGPIGLELAFRGSSCIRIETTVEPGVVRDLGEFRLENGTQISGRMLDEQGKPTSGDVEYRPWVSVPSGPLSLWPQTVAAGSDGAFTIRDLESGRFVLQPHSGGKLSPAGPPVILSTVAGSIKDVELRCSPMTAVSFKCENRPGRQLVTVQDLDGSCVDQQFARLSRGAAFAHFMLAPGQYSVLLQRDGDAPSSRTILVGMETLRLTLAPP